MSSEAHRGSGGEEGVKGVEWGSGGLVEPQTEGVKQVKLAEDAPVQQPPLPLLGKPGWDVPPRRN